MFSTYQQNGYRKLMVIILCRIPSSSTLQQIRGPLRIFSFQKDIFDKPFQGSFIFSKDFVYRCLSTHTVFTEKGWIFQRKGCENMQPKKLYPYISLPVKSSVCHMWLHWLFGHFLPTAKTLKESESYVWVCSGGRTGLSREEREALSCHSLENIPSWPRFHWTPPSSSLTFGSSLREGRIMTQLLMTALWLQLAEEKN